jgi:hypothetical protein
MPVLDGRVCALPVQQARVAEAGPSAPSRPLRFETVIAAGRGSVSVDHGRTSVAGIPSVGRSRLIMDAPPLRYLGQRRDVGPISSGGVPRSPSATRAAVNGRIWHSPQSGRYQPRRARCSGRVPAEKAERKRCSGSPRMARATARAHGESSYLVLGFLKGCSGVRRGRGNAVGSLPENQTNPRDRAFSMS